MNIATWMNDTLHNLWESCEVGKIKNIVEDIEGITNEQILSVLHGEQRFYDDDGGLSLEDSTPSENLSTKAIEDNFRDKYYDLISRVVSYSFGISKNYDFDDREGFLYYWKLISNYNKKIEELDEDYKAFVELTGCNNIELEEILKKVYNDLKAEEETDRWDIPVTSSLSYEQVNKDLLNNLNLSNRHVLNLLASTKNYRALATVQMTGSNGMDLLVDYKLAQNNADEARGDKVFAEDILNCIWNSGWLSPNGEFYGCPDLAHVAFTEKLCKHLEIQGVDGNYDRALELKGWIKFSSGRWLYFKDDLVPTKRQLKVISTWLNERAKDTKVYLGEGFVSYDILESLINSAPE